MVPSGQQDHARVGILSIIVRRKSSDAGIALNSLSITFLFRMVSTDVLLCRQFDWGHPITHLNKLY